MGAMAAGKSAKRAAEIACGLDESSGRPVHTVKVHRVPEESGAALEVSRPLRPSHLILRRCLDHYPALTHQMDQADFGPLWAAIDDVEVACVSKTTIEGRWCVTIKHTEDWRRDMHCYVASVD